MGVRCTNSLKVYPQWLRRLRLLRDNSKASSYYHNLYMAQPKWIDHYEIMRIHRLADKIREEGKEVEVDHIVPLNHPYVSGLHWHGNLQIISKKENQKKSNNYWPDMWVEQLEIEYGPR